MHAQLRSLVAHMLTSCKEGCKRRKRAARRQHLSQQSGPLHITADAVSPTDGSIRIFSTQAFAAQPARSPADEALVQVRAAATHSMSIEGSGSGRFRAGSMVCCCPSRTLFYPSADAHLHDPFFLSEMQFDE